MRAREDLLEDALLEFPSAHGHDIVKRHHSEESDETQTFIMVIQGLSSL